MAKIPEAEARLFHNVFVCRRCKTKRKAPIMKVMAKRISCRRCGCKDLRSVRKK